jgi:sortase A
MNAYSKAPKNYATESKPQINTEDWKKYHTAWQNYYQKYYGQYYDQAARTYIEKEKLKIAHTPTQSSPPIPDIDPPKSRIQSIRTRIRAKASDHASKLRKSRHFIPIIIGISVILIFLILQYNRIIIANVTAYVSPGDRTVDEIAEIDPTVTAPVSPDPKLIIPKINVEVPIVFGIGNDQASLQSAMSHGVAHFAIPGASAMPGEIGNLVISGHSSNGVFEQGAYKFIFAKLERMSTGDLIYINYNSTRYTYQITGTQVVAPTDVQSLIYPTDKPILTLITCVPLGTANQRLLVIAEQINPDPKNAPTEKPSEQPSSAATEIPGNSPTIPESIWNFLTGQG